MRAKHTPGPWEIGEQRTGSDLPTADDIYTGIESPGFGLIALVDATPVDDESLEANARLIAAAPELLEALKDIMRRLPTTCGADPAGLAAIAKAEGRET